MINVYISEQMINESKGGFGLVALSRNKILYSNWEQSIDTTKDREALKAVIYAYSIVNSILEEEACLIYTDSQYAIDVCRRFHRRYQANGVLENEDLIKKIDRIFSSYKNMNAEILPINDDCLGCKLARALAANDTEKFNQLVKNNNVQFSD